MAEGMAESIMERRPGPSFVQFPLNENSGNWGLAPHRRGIGIQQPNGRGDGCRGAGLGGLGHDAMTVAAPRKAQGHGLQQARLLRPRGLELCLGGGGEKNGTAPFSEAAPFFGHPSQKRRKLAGGVQGCRFASSSKRCSSVLFFSPRSRVCELGRASVTAL